MSKRRFCLLVFGIGTVIGLLLFSVLQSREPEYGGKKLSEWVLMVSQPSLDDVLRSMVSVSYRNPAEIQPTGAAIGHRVEPAADAIRHIGAAGIPDLLRWRRYEGPPWKVKLFGILNVTVFRSKPLGIQVDAKLRTRAVQSMYALVALGPDAATAIPELSERLLGTNNAAGTIYSAQCLAAIGERGLPALLRGLTNAATPTRMACRIANSIASMGTNALPAVPVLESYLQNTNPLVRRVATNLFRHIAEASAGG